MKTYKTILQSYHANNGVQFLKITATVVKSCSGRYCVGLSGH